MAKKKIKQLFLERRAAPGQALVEFALIIGFVLSFAFIIIESGRMFQAWQTVQNSAREAGRYALTGQFDPACLSAPTPCPDPRVFSIRQVSREAATGLVINPGALPTDPSFFYTEVWGVDQDGFLIPEYAGAANQPLYIRVTYRMGLITPLVNSFLPTVRLIGTVTVNNEDFDQFGSTVTNPSGPPGGDWQAPPYTDFLPDLELTKESIPESVVVDSIYQYKLTIRNRGTVMATNVALTDTLPSGVQFLSASADCTHENGVVVCANLGDILPNPTLSPDPAFRREVILQVRAPQMITVSPTNIVNTATTGAAENELVLSNNTDTAVTQIISDGSDLQIVSMESSPQPVRTGANFDLNITVRNNGPNPVPMDNVTVETTLDGNLTYIGGPGCSFNEATRLISCAVGTLAKNETRVLPITIGAPGQLAEPATFPHAATVYPVQDDPDEANNYRSSFTTVVPSIADLRVTKLSDPPTITRGQHVTYRITVFNNNGPADATDVSIVDTLPQDVVYVSSSPGCVYNAAAGRVSCSIASLPPNQQEIRLVTVYRPITSLNTSPLVNRVDVSATELDPNPDNNFAIVETPIVEADLAIVQMRPSGTPTVIEGTIYEGFTVTARNNGPSPATGVVLTTTLSSTFNYVGSTITKGACSHTVANNRLVCNIGSLAVSETLTLTLRIVPTQAGTHGIATRIKGNQGDIFPGNDTGQASIIVARTSNYYTTVTPGCGDPGSSFTISGFNFHPGNSNLTITLRRDGQQQHQFHNADQNGPTWNYTYNIPSDTPFGAYNIRAVKRNPPNDDSVDRPFMVPCPRPDLIIGDLETITQDPVSNAPVQFRATISNIGTGHAISQFFVGVYVFNPTINPPPVSLDDEHIPETYRAGIIGVNGLQIGQSRTVTITASASRFPITGTYQIYMVVDSDPSPRGVIVELYDNNNIAQLNPPLVIGEGDDDDDEGPIGPTGVLTGTTAIEIIGGSVVPQPFTPLRLYNLYGDVIVEGESDNDSAFLLELVPVLPEGQFYTLVGCIIIDGTSYSGQIGNITVQESVVTGLPRPLVLRPGSCFDYSPNRQLQP